MTLPWTASTPSIAFEGQQLIASGPLAEVARKAWKALQRGAVRPILVFDGETSRLIELDLRGTEAEVAARLPQPEELAPRGPGRPKLGVIPREVTLLPRHWEWLNRQPGGASVALRKLVEGASRVNEQADRVREARESAYRFMSAMAGNLPGFEEAVRMIFAGDLRRFMIHTEIWPEAIRDHARTLASRCEAG
jgi:hypothetical protein